MCGRPAKGLFALGADVAPRLLIFTIVGSLFVAVWMVEAAVTLCLVLVSMEV